MITPFFTEPSYDTPENTPRMLLDKIFLGTRWCFVGGYVGIVIRARINAVKGLYDDKLWAESSYEIFKLIERCGGRFHLKGLDNLRLCKPPVVFISNHMSTLETFVFPCIIEPVMHITFVVKESLVKHPIFGPVMRSRKPIVVRRKNPRDDFEKVMTDGKKLLSEGTSIIIFPQRTRTTIFNPLEFNTLGIKLAKSAGVQVLPIAIKTDFWGNGKIIKDIGPVHRDKPIYMTFGEPFFIHGNGKQEHKKIIDFISVNLHQWGGIIKL